MDKIISDDFDLSGLSDLEKSRLNNNHCDFMKKNIEKEYKTDSTHKEVYKFAKSLGSKRIVIDF